MVDRLNSCEARESRPLLGSRVTTAAERPMPLKFWLVAAERGCAGQRAYRRVVASAARTGQKSQARQDGCRRCGASTNSPKPHSKFLGPGFPSVLNGAGPGRH